MVGRPDDDEKKSFAFGGTCARPRKGIERQPLSGVTYLKPPGSCCTRWPGLGINVEVECCDGSNIYVLDPCEQVQISDCVGCRIIIGPCVGSVLIFDCKDCTVCFAAKQTRLRDCSNCELRGYAPTLEAIVVETSKSLRFGCWDVCYPGLAEQFRSAKWLETDPTNYWDKIFDFSPAEKGKAPNYTLLPGVSSEGRWCQLTLSPEGLCGGTVVETRSNEPSIEGCDNPIAADDGTLFASAWYNATDDLKAAEVAAATAAAAKEAAISTADIAMSVDRGSSAQPGFLRRALSWLFGGRRASRASAYSAGSVVDTPTQGGGKTTQVCTVS